MQFSLKGAAHSMSLGLRQLLLRRAGLSGGTAAGNRSRYTPLATRSRQSHVRCPRPGITAPLPHRHTCRHAPPTPSPHHPHVAFTFVFSQLGISVFAFFGRIACFVPPPRNYARGRCPKSGARRRRHVYARCYYACARIVSARIAKWQRLLGLVV